ncbi:hypothetical protein RRG08_059292 [Elysia crispata]|uniref:Uncharacterized protein n=1 Tax=Elysia crispata TaxID=231223 RepID=A0AAE0ZBK4_9GAST|nr:hypothetical protein RRG08_059292 [Elysia crispata]
MDLLHLVLENQSPTTMNLLQLMLENHTSTIIYLFLLVLENHTPTTMKPVSADVRKPYNYNSGHFTAEKNKTESKRGKAAWSSLRSADFAGQEERLIIAHSMPSRPKDRKQHGEV